MAEIPFNVKPDTPTVQNMTMEEPIPGQFQVGDPSKAVQFLPSPSVSGHHAAQMAQRDALITGDRSDADQRKYQYSLGEDTVYNQLIHHLEDSYNNEFIDYGVLKDLTDKTPQEVSDLIMGELERLGNTREATRNLLAMNMLRAGFGHLPVKALDEAYSQLSAPQISKLHLAYRNQQMAGVREVLDRVAAEQGEGFTTGRVIGDVAQQDLVPFLGTTTRVLGTLNFVPEDLEISTWKKFFPGEIRQEIREWWVQATPQERRDYLNDIEEEWSKIRKGPRSHLYTRYLAIENLTGIFTEQLLQEDDPKETLDRIFGNLDTALGTIIAVGLVAKRGKSIFDLWSGPKHNQSRQLATAAGARQAQADLDKSIQEMAVEMGWSTDEAAIYNMPRPRQLHDDVGTEVHTTRLTDEVTPNGERRKNIMSFSNRAEQTLLTGEDRANAVKRVLDEYDEMGPPTIQHNMTLVEGMDDGVGVRLGVVVGGRHGEGWHDIDDLMEEMLELDPYREFKILRRGSNGKLEELDISWNEMIDYWTGSGRIPAAFDSLLDQDSLPDIVRHFGMRRLSRISNRELSAALDNGWLEPGSEAYDTVRKELNDRADPRVLDNTDDPMLLVDGEELFVRFDVDHYFDSADQGVIDGIRYHDVPFKQSMIELRGTMFPPNTKFGSLYEAMRQSYHMEEAVLSQFADILIPFDNLSQARKRQVQEVIEWVENEAGKAYTETGRARAPSTTEIMSEFGAYGEDVLEGYFAMREAMDGLYDVFNRRLYRDLTNRGGVTVRAHDDSLPNYHGTPMRANHTDKDLRFKDGYAYDPVTREMVHLDAAEFADLVEQGGGVIKLDLKVDVPGGGKADQILARKGEYDIGPLSKRPLQYYEGYQFRFYEDPYYLIKRTYNPHVNGEVQEGFVEEVVRMSGSQGAAKAFLNRRHQYIDNGKGEWKKLGGEGTVTFRIVRSNDVNQTEGTLYEKQALHQQGRLFWDERNRQRLPDTNGNMAELADPWQAMQKGIHIGVRQSTQESLFKAMRRGFKNEFGDMPEIFIKNTDGTNKSHLFELEELRDVERQLKETIRATVSGETKVRYKRALEYIKYMRVQMGTNTAMVPAMRGWVTGVMEWLENYTPGVFKRFGSERLARRSQRWGARMDPFSRARRIAYGALMVLRVGRQALLQSTQITMLTGLAPVYIGSGKIALDTIALRRGLRKLRSAGFDDGWSDSKVAKAMGLSKKEYKRLVEEFSRSGLLGSVNTHAFNAGGRGLKAPLRTSDGLAGKAVYGARATMRRGYNLAARIGFEFGERNNLTFTYLVALKRIQKKYKNTDLTKLTREQWDEITSEADGLALGMTRPNKFSYQTGMTGVITQFISFQHRALLTFAGLNPKLSKADTVKIWLSSIFLWGSNMAGVEEWTQEMLAARGLSNWGMIPIGDGISIADIITSGMIDIMLNNMLEIINDDHIDINFGQLAPGASILQLYETVFDLITGTPTDFEWLGPFANQLHAGMSAIQFLLGSRHRPDWSPAEKIVRSAAFFAEQALPVWNDFETVWLSAQHQEWVDRDGDKMGIQAPVSGLVARGLFGLRPDAELSIYRARELMWTNDKNVDNYVNKVRPLLRRIVSEWYEGKRDRESAYILVSVIHSWTESAPEGVRREVYRRLMTEPDLDGKSVTQIMAENASKPNQYWDKLIFHAQNDPTLTPEQRQEAADLARYLGGANRDADLETRKYIDQDLQRNRGQE
jgi:hypothetical protein